MPTMSGDVLRAAQATEAQAAQGPDTPSAEELFCEEALARLRHDLRLGGLIQALREREAQVTARIDNVGLPAACRACIDVVADDMRETGLSVSEAALADPADFFQATRELPFSPSTASDRRRAREVARTIMLASQGSLCVPASAGELRDVWEQAMIGEPRLSDSFPSSEFRTCPISLRGPLPDFKLLHECMDAAEVPGWLEVLIGLLADEGMPTELRAACGLCLHDWIHPFKDGNGHTGRLLALAVLGERYSLPTLALFSRELVVRRSVAMGLFGLLRTRSTDINGFCLGLLGQLQDAQALALRVLE